MKLIYVISPTTGDETDIQYAKQACRTVMESGYAFIAPRLMYPPALEGTAAEEQQAEISKMEQILLHRSDEVWVFGPVTSREMRAKIAEAKKNYIPVRKKVTTEELNAPMRQAKVQEVPSEDTSLTEGMTMG